MDKKLTYALRERSAFAFANAATIALIYGPSCMAAAIMGENPALK